MTHVSVSDSRGLHEAKADVSLAPHGSQFFSLATLLDELPGNPQEGGVRIMHDPSLKRAIAIEGALENADTGYSLSMPLVPEDTRQIRSEVMTGDVQYAVVGLQIGAPEAKMNFPQGTSFVPYATVRNLSAKPLVLSAVATYTSGKPNRVQLPDIALYPGEVQQLSLASMLAGLKLPSPVTDLNLMFSYRGAAGDLVIASGSTAKDGSYVFAVDPQLVAAARGSIESYWQVEGKTDTMISLWNPGSKAEDDVLEVNYGLGSYKMPVHLEPNAASSIDLAELVATGTPDAAGHTIPRTVTQGILKLANSAGGRALIATKMHASVFNVETATCREPCPPCDDIIYVTALPSTASTGIGGNIQYLLSATDHYGNTTNETSRSTWSSLNTGIATVSSSALATGQAIGSTNIQGHYVDQGYRSDSAMCNYPTPPCPVFVGQPQQPINIATVSVTNADLWDNQITVTLSGAPFATGILNVTLVGSASKYSFQYGSGAVGPGNYSVPMNRPAIPADTYTSIQATWTVGSGNVAGALPVHWKVFGVVRHSQYNTPSENACVGSPANAWIIVLPACSFTPISLKSDFTSQVYINGTSYSASHGILKYTPGIKNQCSYPPGSNDSNTFLHVSSITGSCNRSLDDSSVATYPNPVTDITTFGCGDNLAIITGSNAQQARKFPEDYCPSCNGQFNGTNGHIDNYSTSSGCSGHFVGDYGNFWTADTYSND